MRRPERAGFRRLSHGLKVRVPIELFQAHPDEKPISNRIGDPLEDPSPVSADLVDVVLLEHRQRRAAPGRAGPRPRVSRVDPGWVDYVDLSDVFPLAQLADQRVAVTPDR